MDTEVREKMDVREVVVPCERREERSEVVIAVDWTEVRAEGRCERGRGAFEGGIAIVAVAATGGGGGGRWRVFWREREELLAEEVRITVYVGDGMGWGLERKCGQLTNKEVPTCAKVLHCEVRRLAMHT